MRPGWAAVLKVVPGTPVQASKESEMDCSISVELRGRALGGDCEDRGARQQGVRCSSGDSGARRARDSSGLVAGSRQRAARWNLSCS